MSKHTVKKQVQNREFEFTKVEASNALRMFNKITKIINKGVSAVNKNLDVDLKDTKKMIGVISDVLACTDESDFDMLNDWIRKYVSVGIDRELASSIQGAHEGDFAPLSNSVVFEETFRGRLDLHLHVIVEFLIVNFLDSLKNLQNIKASL